MGATVIAVARVRQPRPFLSRQAEDRRRNVLAMTEPLVNIITLGARDIDALTAFYRALGWPQVADGELKVFVPGGGAIALFPVDQLARDAHAAPEPANGGVRFAVEVLVESREEVDELAARVERAGGRLTKPPEDAEFFDGRSCYFADPEDNYFEIAWAPRDNPVVAAARRAAGLDA
jgi:catechol 2,3-dioxygenase-like lactoylglutathione lyase family enzyme